MMGQYRHLLMCQPLDRRQCSDGASSTKSNMFYVYVYIDENDIPYYVGKGKGKRAYGRHAVEVPTEDRIHFLAKGLTEDAAFELERKSIREIGRKDRKEGPLLNKTDGGHGVTGHKHTEEQRKGCGNAWRGKTFAYKGKEVPLHVRTPTEGERTVSPKGTEQEQRQTTSEDDLQELRIYCRPRKLRKRSR